MNIIGIICEYNPFHMGHLRQFSLIRQQFGEDCTIVCLMSGNYVQRGAPAVFDKCIRAEAAVRSGADLVLELPTQACLSSAEGFAASGVSILGKLCDTLSFGTESLEEAILYKVAAVLDSEAFSAALKRHLADGISFPTARQKALEELVGPSAVPVRPNDILGVEYCKAILQGNYSLKIAPIKRDGDYHAQELDQHAPSATAIRNAICNGGAWLQAVPACTQDLFANACVHTLHSAERAILYRLRTMSDEEFEALPYGSEGLWRRFMHASRSAASLEDVIQQTKTKRYTRTRIDRMLLCAFLGIDAAMLNSPAPYIRILAFNEKGRTILKNSRHDIRLYNVGEKVDSPYWLLEQRWADLYGLFANESEPPSFESKRRIYYHKET